MEGGGWISELCVVGGLRSGRLAAPDAGRVSQV